MLWRSIQSGSSATIPERVMRSWPAAKSSTSKISGNDNQLLSVWPCGWFGFSRQPSSNPAGLSCGSFGFSLQPQRQPSANPAGLSFPVIAFDRVHSATYLFQWATIARGTQAEFLDKGKPVARLGRKAMGLVREIARLPKGIFFAFHCRSRVARTTFCGDFHRRNA